MQCAKDWGTDAVSNRNIYHSVRAQWAIYVFFFLVLVAVPWVFENPFTLNQIARYCIFGMLALSVSVCWGFGGILSLGQGIAFGLAAYGMGMTMQMQAQDPEYEPVPSFMLTNELTELPMLWEPFWSTPVGLALAIAVPVVFFILFGALMFQARVAGAFVAIMTLAMLAAWYNMAYDMQPFTAGFNGISPPRAFEFLGIVFDPFSPLSYFVVVGLLAVLTLGMKLILSTKFGLIIQAIRDDSERVRFLGYNVAIYQVVIFAISGFIAAVAGIAWVMTVQYVSPTSLEVQFSIAMVVWAAVGGRMSLLGAVLGAFIVKGIESYVGDELRDYWMLVLGGLFMIVVRFLPTGLAGLYEVALGHLTRLFGGGRTNDGEESDADNLKLAASAERGS